MSACLYSSLVSSNRGIVQHMREYEKTVDVTYAQSEGISALVEAAGRRSDIFYALSL